SILVAKSTAAMFTGCVDDPAGPGAEASDGAAAVRTVGRAPAVANAGLAPALALASRYADALAADRPVFLHASPNDAFAQSRVEASGGLSYVAYERAHLGLPVIGGDFVLVLDGAG